MKSSNIKYIILFSIVLFITALINVCEYNTYRINYNNKISSIIELVVSKYQDISKEEIYNIINNKSDKSNILKEYGIYDDIDNLVIENENKYTFYLVVNLMLVVILFIIFYIIIFKDKYLFNKNINKLTKYFSEINNGNYDIDINDNKENNLSILKNEIYKTTIMLKEQASNSKKDKEELKVMLEDISHQLKTPLTAINIYIDNLLDNDIDYKTRNEFLKEIKKDINNMNFLILNLLKLSKFDTNTIKYEIKKYKVDSIISKIINNLSYLSDLKNININVIGNKNIVLNCDYRWEIEAISNIVKNALEHCYSKVEISYKEYKSYVEIRIINDGDTINKKDIKHIFDRFYKISNDKDSIGIGLALSKSIIEKDNGKINVISDNNSTIFEIKYYKY